MGNPMMFMLVVMNRQRARLPLNHGIAKAIVIALNLAATHPVVIALTAKVILVEYRSMERGQISIDPFILIKPINNVGLAWFLGVKQER